MTDDVRIAVQRDRRIIRAIERDWCADGPLDPPAVERPERLHRVWPPRDPGEISRGGRA